ncbi:MAG: YncE family protein [Prevotellaceae bacterium]|jgi:DNA-binding beta-propeller fold protein YncE|nr:YncE family protein [Prevotellaceae bacterium]
MSKIYCVSIVLVLFLIACRDEDSVVPSTQTSVGAEESDTIKGFFLLNEGSMGSNKASLDYFDYDSGVYHRNIFAERNPNIVNELGDVGNDIRIYGNKVYIVVNCSHLLEVLDVTTAKHIASIAIPNCRYVTFDKGYAYVSSYAGPVLLNSNARLGYVAKIDTVTLTVKDTCVVGYQPEEMVIRNNKLYVANSGGYYAQQYDNTVSVIDLDNFTEIKKITVAINLYCMILDNQDNIYVGSRSDYNGIKSNIYIIDSQDKISDALNVSTENMALCGDSLYVCGVEWNQLTNSSFVSYTIINTVSKNVISSNFITDGTDEKIEMPYGIAINPQTKDIYILDAKDFINPGVLYCFSSDGKKKWEVTTGDIPTRIAFTRKQLR